MADGEDQNLEPDDDTQDDNIEDDAGDGSAEDDAASKAPKKSGDKRVDDLMSKWQAAEARASKAEKALKARSAGEGNAAGANDPAVQALIADLRESNLDAVYASFPELSEFGIERSLIEGANRTEMRENAESLVALIKNVSTKARNKALADAGVDAELSGASRKPPVDFGQMSDEDFVKLLDSMG